MCARVVIFKPTTQAQGKKQKEQEMQYHMEKEEGNRQQKQSAKLPCESLDTSFAGIRGLSINSSASSITHTTQQQQQKKKGMGGVMGREEGGDVGPSHSPLQAQELSQQTFPLNGASITCTALKASLEEHNLCAPIFLDICNELGAETVEELAYITPEMLNRLLVKPKPIQLAKLLIVVKRYGGPGKEELTNLMATKAWSNKEMASSNKCDNDSIATVRVDTINFASNCIPAMVIP